MRSEHTIAPFGAVPAHWLWGIATSSHQVEGGNEGNDWSRWEQPPGVRTAEPSGAACDSWNRWPEDLRLVAGMGLDAYRFSLEWSRIEPQDGVIDQAALDTYAAMLRGARDLGLRTMVTLHSFTTPQWVVDRGGWEAADTADLFARYAGIVAAQLGELIDVAVTFNEPNTVTSQGYWNGVFPPGFKQDVAALERATDTFLAAHRAGASALREGPGDFPVGLTVSLQDVVVHVDDDPRSPGVHLVDHPEADPTPRLTALLTTVYLEAARRDDFIGVQTYMTQHVGSKGQALEMPPEWRVTNLGYLYSPEAVLHTVPLAARVAEVPIMITGTGVTTDNEDERIEYYARFLAALRTTMDADADVRGFIAWSLIDNFEWQFGFAPHFGMHSVDRTTFARTPKVSARWYAEVVRASRV
ncbi:glycoside hydrolase family 1 protein [Demequina silvatica]|uniref:glycoside hydrolase family 1 protein n=1 Tax=Demequina silvatica TaxID=1638988 RepID=UPI0007827B52|nr:family 1 glycosylhydrolase [Demequina silvatica]